MFNDSDSFYYSPTGDLTNSLQRQCSGKYNHDEQLWMRVRINYFGRIVIAYLFRNYCIQYMYMYNVPVASLKVYLRMGWEKVKIA